MKRDDENVRVKFDVGELTFAISSHDKSLRARRQSVYTTAFVKYVTVSGLYQVWTRDKTLGRPLWIVILLLITALGLRDLIVISIAALTSETIHTEQELRFDQHKLELPNISVCVPVTYDRQRVSEDFAIPDEALRRMQRGNWTKNQILEEFTRYLSFYNIYAQVGSRKLERVLQLITADERNAPYVLGNVEVLQRYLPNCQETIFSCSLADVPFNCCDISQLIIGQTSVCFAVSLNNEQTKVYQSVPGPGGGLVMDVVWNGTNAFYLDNLADEGLYVFVNDIPSLLSIPSVVWPFTHVYVKLVSKQRYLIENCYLAPPKLKFIDFYDPIATNCVIDFQIQIFEALMNCEMPIPPHMPEAGKSCTIEIVKSLFNRLVNGSEDYLTMPGEFSGASVAAVAIVGELFKSVIGSVDSSSESLEKTMFNPPMCKRLCAYSYYDTIVSYASLAGSNIDFDLVNETMLRSRITVYYGDFDYSISRDQFAVNGYVSFNQIGSILGVYAGVSVVTFVQVVVYGFGSIRNIIKRKIEHMHD